MSEGKGAMGTSHIQAVRHRLQSAACLLDRAGNSHRMVGFITAYVPEELFHAAGLTPVYVFHTSEDQGYARTYLPGFTCWAVRSVLDQALAGQLKGLIGIALGKTCDTTQGLADLWPQCMPTIPLFHFGMPTQLDGYAARAYLLAELASLRQRLQETVGCSISDDDLLESIAVYHRTRSLVRQLYIRAVEVSPPSFYDLIRAAYRTPKGIYNAHLAQLLTQPFVPPENDEEKVLRTILVGSELGDPALFDALERAGACVVGDMFDLGERYFALNADEKEKKKKENPMARLVDRLLTLVPTPTKYDPSRQRSAYLLSLVRERNADGVIFARQTYCEPYGFDIVRIGQALKKAEVPYLSIELEQASQAGQLSTRIEAFCEMIRSA